MNKHLKWAIILLSPFVILSCSEPSIENKGVATSLANAGGLKDFSSVKSIEFTFNVDKDSSHIERHWKWMPKKRTVIFFDKADSTVFKIMDTTTDKLKKLNAQFTNDQYWLLFPLHLQWDNGYTLTTNDTATGPVTGKSYHKYTVQYNGKDGFTPGDMYELYADDQFVIQEWAFHKTGAKEPTLMTTWEGYQNFRGLKIATEHKTSDGNFRLYFTGITVTF